MAKDDYFRIVYLILRYLYSQMKKGIINVELDDLLENSDLPSIPESYFNEIVKNLFDDGYITGEIKETKYIHERYPRIIIKSLKIKPKGIEYLNDNSMMKKVAKALGDISDIVGII